MEKISLEDVLVSKGKINKDQLKKARAEAASSGQSLRGVLVKLGLVPEGELVKILSEVSGLPYLDLSTYLIDPAVIAGFPEELAHKYQVLPLFKIGDTLTLGVLEPLDIYILDEIRLKAGGQIELVLVNEDKLRKALDEHYKMKGSIEEIAKSVEPAFKDEDFLTEKAVQLEQLVEIAEEAPVVKIVNLILSEAISNEASDVHIEPEEKGIRVRTRIDGILHETNVLEKHLQAGIITRVKILSRMDIAESRRPQDGRFQLKFANKEVDVRVSSYPTVFGENIVLRLLGKSALFFGLEHLGLSKELFAIYEEQIKRPYGIILVTGPTGSGKTTTLYASLSTINDVSKNIITVEDPVEYRLPNIRQSQVNYKIDLTFANGLRSILRQDPDIIMVGEIRDMETAEMAIQAALTGHLVFSTLHTNDAPGALTRLLDMSMEPFLIASSMNAAMAQRLVRKVCQYCKEPVKVEPTAVKAFGLINEEKIKNAVFYEGKGCKNCRNSGYSGRIGIFELMVVSDEIVSLIMEKAPANRIREAAAKQGFKNLRMDGFDKALAGVTSLKEVLRVTQLE